MDDRDKIIITIVFSIIGIIAAVLIVCFIVWFICRWKSRSYARTKVPNLPYGQPHERSFNLASTAYDNSKRRKRKQKFNTNDSSLSFSFDPPHLINQNVRNLDKLLPFDSPMNSNVWHPEPPTRAPMGKNNVDRLHTPSINEPVYTSTSSLSTPTINPATVFRPYQRLNSMQIQFLNELNRDLCSRQDEKRSTPLKYSQSYRQPTDYTPYTFHQSATPSLSASSENAGDTPHNRTAKHSNAALTRKANLGQLQDDTAILY